MRVLVITLGLMVACAAVAIAAAQSSSGSGICGSTPSVSAADEMLDQCVMYSLNISKETITNLRSQGLSNSDIVVAAAIAMKTNLPVTDIVAEYKANPNWPEIAKKHNLSMSDLNVVSLMMADTGRETFNQTFISQYYAIPESDVMQMRKDGKSWGDINMIANASTVTKQPVSQIVSLRDEGMSWRQIADKYNVSESSLMIPTCMRQVATERPATGAGPATISLPCVMYDSRGSQLLDQLQVGRLYREGYDWLDVAIAANISRDTGWPIREILLQKSTRGQTWVNIVRFNGLDPKTVFNVTDYPFERRSNYSPEAEQKRLTAIEKYQCPCPERTKSCGVMYKPILGYR